MFTQSEIERNWFIWQIFRDGGVSLIHRDDVLQRLIKDLRDANYSVRECAEFGDDELAFEKSLRQALGFPGGQPDRTRLDAIEGRIADMEFPDSAGVVVVARHIQRLHQRSPDFLHDVMDIFAIESRYHMCRGRRLILVLQSDDPDITLGPIGGYKPVWHIRKNVP